MISWLEWFCIFAALTLAAVVTALPSPAHAQYACGIRSEIIKAISTKYQEVPRFVGIAGKYDYMEVYLSDSGSWTMLITKPKGLTCVVGTGDSWEALPVTVYGHAT